MMTVTTWDEAKTGWPKSKIRCSDGSMNLRATVAYDKFQPDMLSYLRVEYDDKNCWRRDCQRE